MKKILSVFLLVFAFSLTASAQTAQTAKETEIKVKAKKDLHDLSKVIDLSNPELFKSLHQLFIDKHSQLTNEGISELERKQVIQGVREKLIATLPEDQVKTLIDSGLLDKLSQ